MLGYYGAGLLDSLPWLKTAAAIIAVAFFLVGTGWGLYRYRQDVRRPIDDTARHPEDELPDLRDTA